MVSRRNYLTVAIMMLILFFMFQFTGVMKNQLNEYGVNEYDQSTYTHLNAENTFSDIVSGSSASADVFYVGAVSWGSALQRGGIAGDSIRSRNWRSASRSECTRRPVPLPAPSLSALRAFGGG